MRKKISYYTKDLKNDIPSGLVVFLVALPLCLGIALASGAPLFSGIITGVIGGIVVGFLSGSQLAVSGPAAGLTVIVLNGIETLGTFEAFLLTVVIAGIIQLALGFLKAGIIGLYFPVSVIKGMLAGIGLILILKQIPHFLGVDENFFGSEAFLQSDGRNTFSEILYAFSNTGYGPALVGIISLLILIAWEKPFVKGNKVLSYVPGALIAVVVSVLLNNFFVAYYPAFAINGTHLVNLPTINSFDGLVGELRFPDLSQLGNKDIYIVAITIAIVASLETLLSIEAIDKLDPLKRRSSNNQELKAQGVGNILSGLVGGLPMTAVIVRGSTNVAAGGKTKLATITHGVFLFVSVILLSGLLKQIPLSALAAVLLTVGYKLTKPALYKTQFKLGKDQFIPFIVTIIAILLTDLLVGISLGMVIGVFYVLKGNYKTPYFYEKQENEQHDKIKINLSEHVTFLNKASLSLTLDHLPENSEVEINGTNSRYIDYDALEALHDFKSTAVDKNIKYTLTNIPELEAYKESGKNHA